MVANYLTFNGITTKQFEIYVSGGESFKTAERDVEFLEIPGRNGFLLQNNGRFKPVTLNFPAFGVNNATPRFRALVNAFSRDLGIHRIETTFDPDHFRMGVFLTGIEPTVYQLKRAAFDLAFQCQPERWLLSGEIPQEFTASGTITNPTDQTAKPILKITGNGTLRIGETEITVADNAGTITLDAEQGDAYEETAAGIEYRNDRITTTNHNMPELQPGETEIEIPEGITLQIIPRWWEL